MKATFVKRLKAGYKYGRKQGNDILVYSYRGHEYEIEDIPAYQQPAWYFKQQHSEEQKRIDRLIEEEGKPKTQMEHSHEEDMECFFRMFGE